LAIDYDRDSVVKAVRITIMKKECIHEHRKRFVGRR
jgi:hypothetical protein